MHNEVWCVEDAESPHPLNKTLADVLTDSDDCKDSP